MKRGMWIAVVSVVMAAGAAMAEGFSVSAALERPDSRAVLAVVFTVPEHHYLYADEIRVEPIGEVSIEAVEAPPPELKFDAFLAATTAVYKATTTFRYRVTPADSTSLSVKVRYQGCSETLCYLPVTRTLQVGERQPEAEAASEPVKPEVTVTGSPGGWKDLAAGFEVAGSTVGYVGRDAFLEWLGRVESGEGQDRGLRSSFSTRSVWLSLALILLGGLALNLTPCVLPMIPINLAIIGAGSAAGSRWRGFLLGGTYGLGMAIVYGILGLMAVLTGARFGSLNASPLFNFIIAAVFGVLALGMFGVLNVDLSRFQGRVSSPSASTRGRMMTALIMGGVAALLAGACVAPVVISVLLLAGDLYQRGTTLGLALPFLLGVGMALPWPFAGAGLSLLPKPGRWMEYVKYGFGVVIVGFALWYGHLGYSLLKQGAEPLRRGDATSDGAQDAETAQGWLTSLDEGLELAARENRPVFIDFWASWCKNCLVMDATTFRDPEVLQKLAGYVLVKQRAEDMEEPATLEILDHFEVGGLPTYVVLLPKGR